MKSYVIPKHGEIVAHRVIQEVAGKGEREAISEHGNILCDSCDAVLANEGETLNVGEACWRCGSRIVRFESLVS